MAKYSLRNELRGHQPLPKGAKLPTLDELMRLYNVDEPPLAHVALPPDRPMFWIKYGWGVEWSEAVAQDVAHRGLQRSGSRVRAPGVFCAYEMETREVFGEYHKDVRHVFIVMEYISGRTAKAHIEQNPETDQMIFQLIARAIMMLNRLPVPPGQAPSSLSGGHIRHTVFGVDIEAPRTCKNARQLQEHFNLFLNLAKRKERLKDLELEPLVFCYSDIHLENFIILDNDGICVIDFAHTSYLPSSFQKFDLRYARTKLNYDLAAIVELPETKGVDNTSALFKRAALLCPDSLRLFASAKHWIDGFFGFVLPHLYSSFDW